MQAKIRKNNKDGTVRLETSGEVKEIVINEDFLHPKKESIAICFSGKNSSGIIELTPKELEMLIKTAQHRKHLIKGVKILGGER